MILKVASTLAEIVDGWRLVYKQYFKSALIEFNPFSVFTFPEYIGRHSAVILGKEGDETVCSVSAVLDSRQGLPLDVHFHDELDAMRKKKMKLIEIGLLANQNNNSNLLRLIELFSAIARFGVYSGFHDYVIGVNPRRANFFKQIFGFHQIGDSKNYNLLRKAKVILLHAGGLDFETMTKKASNAIYNEESILPFDQRFLFTRLASLLPYKAIVRFITFIIKLWTRFLSWLKNIV